jgi:hypothetical protein
MPYPGYTSEEVARRGEAIYNQQIRPHVEAQHEGKFLVLDIRTGAFEIDADDLVATKRALARDPGAVLYGVRIGSPTAYRIGGGFAVQQR